MEHRQHWAKYNNFQMCNIKSYSQSIPKENSDENEDKIKVSASKSMFALSDGAGGIGVEAHRWAAYLLEKLPEENPIQNFEALSNWQNDIWEAYFKEIETELKERASIALNKFYAEGSLATLVAAWLIGDDTDKKIQVMAYGDSFIGLWHNEPKKFWTNIPKLSSFLENPSLLNCKDEVTENGVYEALQIKQGDVLIIASDTIGQFLLGSYYLLEEKGEHEADFALIRENPSRFSAQFQALEAYYTGKENWQEVLKILKENLDTEEHFRTYTEGLKGDSLLGYDDYSVILVEF